MNLEGSQTSGIVGPVHNNPAVKTAGTQQRLVQYFRPVGGSQQNNSLGGVKAVHLSQQLVQRLFPFVIPAHTVIPGFADGIDLINEDNTGRHLAGLLEEVTHTGGSHTYKHLYKVRTADREKGHSGLSGDSLGQQSLSGARRAYQQRALGQLGANLRVLLRIVEEIDDLLQTLLCLVLTSHIPESNPRLFLHIDFGVCLSHAAQAASHTGGHAPRQEGKQRNNNDQGQHPGDQDRDDRRGLGHIFGAKFDVAAVLILHRTQQRE